ncbi:MAG: alginate export family protein [Candidatus Bathyarchaeota archaeon]
MRIKYIEGQAMRHFSILISIGLFHPAFTIADIPEFNIDYSLDFEHTVMDGLSLGYNPDEDHRIETISELGISLEYIPSDQWRLFFSGVLSKENISLENSGEHEDTSGVERKEMGVAYQFGNSIDAELKVGRNEFVSDSEWWVWWNELLDAITLDTKYNDIEAMIAVAKEQARSFSGDDFIDPEQNAVQRILLSLGWEFSEQHSLRCYVLEHTDRSSLYRIGESVDNEKIDESDADLTWLGLGYQGKYEIKGGGAFNFEVHAARVHGHEYLYVFSESGMDFSNVVGKTKHQVKGSAQGLLVTYQPGFAHNLNLLGGIAQGSGDKNSNDQHDHRYRLTGLQGDSESFGKLFNPDLSNINIKLLGLEWHFHERANLTLMHYQYHQRYAAEEMSVSSIEVNPSGSSQDLGTEIDLLLNLEVSDEMEWNIILAGFQPGKAFPGYSQKAVSYISFEFSIEF